MQKTFVFEVPENIIKMKNMLEGKDFKMQAKVEFREGSSTLESYSLDLLGQKDGNHITFVLDDKNINRVNKSFKCDNENYTVVFSYEMYKYIFFSKDFYKKENQFDIEKDKDFYFVKIDYDGKQVFSKGFKDKNEFESKKDNFKEINEKIDNRDKKIMERNSLNQLMDNYAELFCKLIVFSSFLIIATFVILGLFTGGVAPAILTPLIAKCLMIALPACGALGFFASWFAYRKEKSLEKSINPLQDKISTLQNEIDDLKRGIDDLEKEDKKSDEGNKQDNAISNDRGNEEEANKPKMLEGKNSRGRDD